MYFLLPSRHPYGAHLLALPPPFGEALSRNCEKVLSWRATASIRAFAAHFLFPLTRELGASYVFRSFSRLLKCRCLVAMLKIRQKKPFHGKKTASFRVRARVHTRDCECAQRSALRPRNATREQTKGRKELMMARPTVPFQHPRNDTSTLFALFFFPFAPLRRDCVSRFPS